MDVLGEAVRLGACGERAALATVVRTSGSAPRGAGARMIVCASGESLGTIGGGRLEKEVTDAARPISSGEKPASLYRRHLVQELAMCCGGEVSVWIEPIDEARLPAVSQAVSLRDARTSAALVTTLEVPGRKDVTRSDRCIADRRPRIEGERFFEPVLPTDRLVLFGAGHIARATAAVAATTGFKVVVCDEDDRFASAERFPGARRCASFDVAEIEREVGALGAADYVVIATREHAIDQDVLERLLPRAELAYLGLVGSEGKRGRFSKRLTARGIGSEADWERLRSPVGLDIGAETPEEIAIAIVGEMIRTRASR